MIYQKSPKGLRGVSLMTDRSTIPGLVCRVCAMFAIASLTGSAAMAHGDPLTAWAEAAQSIALPGHVKPSPMEIEDHFPVALAARGTMAETPCSGSRWVYDYAHHIAAGYDGGPEMLLYIGEPPVKLPSRDLSHVSSVRGIQLGDTPEHVTKALNVPLADVTRSSKHRRFLYLKKAVYFRGDTHEYADLAMIVFLDGRVTSIWYAHDEN